MTEPLHVTYLSTAMGLGGADRQVLLLARELVRRGHTAEIVSVVPEGRMGARAREHGIPVSSLGATSWSAAPRSAVRLLDRVGETDVLHSHMFHSNVLARLFRPLLSADAVVTTIHNVYESPRAYRQPERSTVRERLYGLTDRMADHTTCVCQASYDRHAKLGAVSAESADVVYNGIDTDAFRPDATTGDRVRDRYGVDDEFVWLAVGRFFEMKDYPNLLAAFAAAGADRSVLWIVGHGEGEPAAKRVARSLSIEDRVRFLGVVDDVAPYMQAADALVLASRWEGFPMVLLEAQASGLPVVATRVGGVPELIDDGTTGLLVPPEDSDALGARMDELVDMDDSDRRTMGNRGRRRTRTRFDIEVIADHWEETYRRLRSA